MSMVDGENPSRRAFEPIEGHETLTREHVLDIASGAPSLRAMERRLGVGRGSLSTTLESLGEGDLYAEVRALALAPSRRSQLTDQQLARRIRKDMEAWETQRTRRGNVRKPKKIDAGRRT